MKLRQTIALLFSLLAPGALAGTATIFSDSQSNSSASGSGTVVFSSYNATSITITVSASAYGASQQGGGRNYSGAAVATIGSSVQRQDVPSGSDPMSVGATNSLTVAKGGDGNWYASGTNMGSAIAVSASAYVDGENAQGGGTATAYVSWVEAPLNSAPTISWISSPASATSGGSYTVNARGHDADGNLTQVNVWKNGQGFAFAGGGNGTDGDSGNTTSDTGPASITYTAQAVDSAGATSSTISHTVTIAAANSAPTISWISSPAAAASGGSYTITARGHDADGNLTQVNVWKNGSAFDLAGGGNGTDGDSGNTTSDTGPATVTFTANAVDANGATSGTITHTVTVAAPLAVSASITASPTTATAPGATTVSWTSSNAASVQVSGGGLNSTAKSRSQTLSGLSAGTYTFTITAQGNGGPVTQSATLVVSAPAAVTAAISASPTSATAPASVTITWSTANATAVSVTGSGLNSVAANGSQIVSGLSAGSYDYVITAQGPSGPVTQTATVNVSAAAVVTASISANPSSGTEPGTTLIAWTTANATAVAVSGPGLSSVAVSGTQSIGGLVAGTHTFTITAQGPGGPVTQSATVTINAAPAAVTGSISATPDNGTAPGATTIAWSTANATSVSVSGPGLVSAAPSGTQNIGGLAAGTYTYTLTAQGVGGPITRTVTVTISPGASVSGAISVTPTSMNAGGTATLTWSTANATSVRVTGFGITGSPYENSANLTVNVGGLPVGQSTWTLIAEGAGGPITRTATITVNSIDGLAGSLTVSPTVISSNQSATLAWTSSGANFRWVHGFQPGYNGVSVYPAAVSGSRTVTGLAPGEYSFVFEYGPGAFSATRGSYAYLTVLGVNRTVVATAAPVGTGSVSGGGTFAEGSSVTLSATPDGTHVFTGWSGDLTGSTNPLTFTVGAQNYSVTANFALRSYAVMAAAAPLGAGSVIGSGTYPVGATATLAAIADATHTFTGWTGDISSSANPLTFVVNGNTSVAANFASTNFALTTAASPGGSNEMVWAVLPTKLACRNFARSIVTAVVADAPLPSPLQLAKRCVASGVAVTVTTVPAG